jgi:hypothetical protein
MSMATCNIKIAHKPGPLGIRIRPERKSISIKLDRVMGGFPLKFMLRYDFGSREKEREGQKETEEKF